MTQPTKKAEKSKEEIKYFDYNYDFKIGERVWVDEKYRNKSEVIIKSFTPNKMFATVRADNGYEWQTMTSRLTPIIL